MIDDGDDAHAQVEDVSKREEQLQASYVELLDERDQLHALLVEKTGEIEEAR